MTRQADSRNPISYRPPRELRAWLLAQSEAAKCPVGQIITEALTQRRERAERAEQEPPSRRRKAAAVTPAPGPSHAAGAESAPEVPPRRRCTHPGTRVIGGYCKTCDHLTEPGGYWRD